MDKQKPLIIVAVTAVVLVIAYFIYDRTRPLCDSIFDPTTAKVSGNVQLVKTKGELVVGREKVQELTESAQKIGLNFKTCCVARQSGLISADQFQVCVSGAKESVSGVQQATKIINEAHAAKDRGSLQPSEEKAAEEAVSDATASVNKLAGIAAASIVPASVAVENAQILILQRTFIEKYKNRATIDGTFIVDHAHKRPNPPAKDGDLHASGRSNEVGLPMVAEVMNAAVDSQADVVDAIHANEGNGTAASISGAWRIWFEQPSKVPQVQFDDVPPAANTNPDHCFEIHPIIKYAGKPILDSLREIDGFTPKDAEAAFGRYEQLSATLEIDDQTVGITSKQVGFNYVGFIAQLAGKPDTLDKNDAGAIDGQVVLANVMDKEGDTVLVNNVRLIFIAGTPPAQVLASAGDGATLELLALPRLDLNAISAFIEAGGSGSVVRKLPYEMIVVAAKSADGAPAQPVISSRRRAHS